MVSWRRWDGGARSALRSARGEDPNLDPPPTTLSDFETARSGWLPVLLLFSHPSHIRLVSSPELPPWARLLPFISFLFLSCGGCLISPRAVVSMAPILQLSQPQVLYSPSIPISINISTTQPCVVKVRLLGLLSFMPHKDKEGTQGKKVPRIK